MTKNSFKTIFSIFYILSTVLLLGRRTPFLPVFWKFSCWRLIPNLISVIFLYIYVFGFFFKPCLFLYFKSWFALTSNHETKKKRTYLIFGLFQIWKYHSSHSQGICLLTKICSKVHDLILPLACCLVSASSSTAKQPFEKEHDLFGKGIILSSLTKLWSICKSYDCIDALIIPYIPIKYKIFS